MSMLHDMGVWLFRWLGAGYYQYFKDVNGREYIVGPFSNLNDSYAYSHPKVQKRGLIDTKFHILKPKKTIRPHKPKK